MRRRRERAVLTALAEIAVVGAAYYITGRLGLLLAIPPGFASAVWPPSGIALGAMLVRGYRVWPGIVAGSFGLNVATSLDLTDVTGSLGLALSIAVGAALQAALGTLLIRSFVGFPNALGSLRDVIVFLALGGPVACLVNATVGPTSLLLFGAIDGPRYAFSWWTWWTGDVLGVLTITPLVLVLLAEPKALWASRRTSVGLPLVTMFALSAVVFVWASSLEQARIRTGFEQRALAVVDDVASAVDVHGEVVESVASLFLASDEVTRQEFETFVGRALAAHDGIQALSWNPWVDGASRERFESDLGGVAITERGPGGELVPRAPASAYVPVLLIEPFADNEPAVGFDVYSDPVRAAAIDAARSTGLPSATAPITLVQDDEPTGAYLLFVPVVDPDGTLLGFATGAFRVRDVVGTAAGRLAFDGLRMVATDDRAPGDPVWESTGAAAVDGYALGAQIGVADRTWTVGLEATQSFVDDNRSIQAWAILAAGSLFSGLLGMSLLAMTGRTARIEVLVEERTAEVLEVNRELEVARTALQSRVEELARSNAELERFAYIASHDLQEPLRAVAAHTQMLQRRYAGRLDDDADESIGYAVDGAKRMQALIDDLLTYSRLGREAEHGAVDTAEVVAYVLTDLHRALETSGARVDIGDLPTVHGDATGLGRLFLNLIDNAIKFAGDSAPHVTVTAEPHDDGWEFIVRDRGIGFDPSYAERIFGMFERLHSAADYPGTGIGLAIVQRVVELHGGRITVDSAPGEGAEFRFTLPAARPDEPVASSP